MSETCVMGQPFTGPFYKFIRIKELGFFRYRKAE